jgi:hypothetical protein
LVYVVHPAAIRAVEQLASLATDLLPDFIDGRIDVEIVDPTRWVGDRCKIDLHYVPRDQSISPHAISGAGEGPARWMAAAVQIALHLIAEDPDLTSLRDVGRNGLSGHVVLVDEPKAHLHPSAVVSIVRWCQYMVQHGFTLIVASHHEEFLRAPGDEFTLVHVSRDAGHEHPTARTLPALTATRLQELAVDVGLHPATALSLHCAILFVEGPLDEAVLDEYGGLRLDAAGVKIIPIRGTKNVEGLVAFEVVTELGMKLGVLTDATDPTTMAERSKRKRSSEERKVMTVIQIAKDKGLTPPTPFGVPEDELLFALPADAIRDYLQGPFPGWKERVAECRELLGKGPSDSVDWKSYAWERYQLPISTSTGVRQIVRHLDLQNVPLPHIDRVIDEVVNWATK